MTMELSRNLKIDSVSRLNPPPPVLIDAIATVGEAIARMQAERVSCLVIVNGSKLVGIFTERDVLTRVLATHRPFTTPLADCMTADPITVQPKDSVRTAIKRMQSGGYRHLPVVDEAQRPLGLLSAKRIVNYLAEHFPATICNQPPVANQVPETAEGA
jgi:CBS domain-containing protein